MLQHLVRVHDMKAVVGVLQRRRHRPLRNSDGPAVSDDISRWPRDHGLGGVDTDNSTEGNSRRQTLGDRPRPAADVEEVIGRA